MSYVITKSPKGKGEPVETPTKPDGEPWRYSMCFSGGWRWAWADSVETLVGVLTGDPVGYEQAEPQAQLEQRLRLMMRHLTIAQATMGSLLW